MKKKLATLIISGLLMTNAMNTRVQADVTAQGEHCSRNSEQVRATIDADPADVGLITWVNREATQGGVTIMARTYHLYMPVTHFDLPLSEMFTLSEHEILQRSANQLLERLQATIEASKRNGTRIRFAGWETQCSENGANTRRYEVYDAVEISQAQL